MRRFGLYAALALFVCGLPATAAPERFGQWSLDRPEGFIFSLSSKRTIRFFLEPQHQNSRSFAIKRINTLRSYSYRSTVHSPADIRTTPVTIQKIEDRSGPSDVMQRWENGPGYYIFLESPDSRRNLPRT